MPRRGSVTGQFSPMSGLGRINFNSATGGTVSTFASGGFTYKRHVFTATGSQTLTVLSNQLLFTVMVLGGGGGGSAGYIAGIGVGGATGGGSGAFEGLLILPIGANVGTVGTGGAGGSYGAGAGVNGTSTTFAGRTGGYGGRGGTEYGGYAQGGGAGDGATGNGATGGYSTQTGGGSFGPTAMLGATLRNAYSLGSAGNGGGGGGQSGPGGGAPGSSGAIVVTYRII